MSPVDCVMKWGHRVNSLVFFLVLLRQVIPFKVVKL